MLVKELNFREISSLYMFLQVNQANFFNKRENSLFSPLLCNVDTNKAIFIWGVEENNQIICMSRILRKSDIVLVSEIISIDGIKEDYSKTLVSKLALEKKEVLTSSKVIYELCKKSQIPIRRSFYAEKYNTQH